MKNTEEIAGWNVERSKELYGISNWGSPYFSINVEGNIEISPNGETGQKLDLLKLVEEVQARDIEAPILFRFNNILKHRVQTIHNAFQAAIKENDYKGTYSPAYPIKVNQHRQIIEVIREIGQDFELGLEVGSKPELIAVLALHDNPNALLLCNGYKDETYIEFALTSKKVGRNPIIIIEKYSELELVLRTAERLNIEPSIGFRLKLAGKGAGRWEHSGGDRSKFGLTVSEIVKATEELRKREKLSSLRLLHFHMGSQITAISSMRSALKEATQVYVQLKQRCPQLEYLDVGGGLGVDYDGSQTSFESSMNYSVDEYARDIIWTVDEITKEACITPPNIITESGRATVAHHSVLVFNVLGSANSLRKDADILATAKQSEQSIINNMACLLEDLCPKNCHETLHDVVALRNDILSQFNMGLVTIEDRGIGDRLYWALLNGINKAAHKLNYIPEDLEKVPAMLTDTYFCNFSIFQSLPDSWAIEQIFPITPIHRLNEEPNSSVVLADITCDSDGTISRFADLRDVKHYLPTHKLKDGEPYYMAAFLVGAYQEILGDLHNLFGDTNTVHIDLSDEGKVQFSSLIRGDTVEEVLRYVQYDKNDLCERWRNTLEKAVSRGDLSTDESREIFRKYVNSFDGYTYLGK